MEEETTFDPDLIHGIFKGVWGKMALEQERTEASDAADSEFTSPLQAGASTTKRHRPTTANANALKLSAELLRLFVVEAVQRSASIAEVEGATKIEATHLERILPQLLLDF